MWTRALGVFLAIADKTRKILWGRSGNRCAICRHELVIDATTLDDNSVVGEECHIVSPRGLGPRNEPAFPEAQFDEPGNLILLCRVHHKMVDDQCETYTVDLLRQVKASHENWVSTSLSEDQLLPPVRVKRLRENIPTHLARLDSGDAILSLVQGASSLEHGHDKLRSRDEFDLVAGFFQAVQEYGDMSDIFEAGDQVRAGFEVSEVLKELEAAGFWAFGAREVRRLVGGRGPARTWPVAIIRVVRATSPEILKVDLTSLQSDESQGRAYEGDT